MTTAQLKSRFVIPRWMLVVVGLTLSFTLFWSLQRWNAQHPPKMHLFEDAYRLITPSGLSTFWYSSHKEFQPGQYQVTVDYAIEDNFPDPENWAKFEVLSYNENNVYYTQLKPLRGITQNTYTETFSVNIPEDIQDFQVKITTDYSTFGVRDIYVQQPGESVSYALQLIDWTLLLAALLMCGVFVFNVATLSKLTLRTTVIVLILATFTCAVSWPKPTHLYGDEPHYLVVMKNLFVNHTFDMKRGYVPDIVSEFWYGSLEPHTEHSDKTGHLYSHHSYLTSALLIPGYLLGQLSGVRLEIAGVFTLCVLCVFLTANALSAPRWSAVASSLGLLLTPFVFYAFSIYPEIFAALALIFGVYASQKQNLPLKSVAMMLLGAAVLQNGKYLGPALGIACLVGTSIFWAPRDGTKQQHTFFGEASQNVLVAVSFVVIFDRRFSQSAAQLEPVWKAEPIE